MEFGSPFPFQPRQGAKMAGFGSAEPMFTFWDYKRERWARDAGLRLDHLLLNLIAAARLVDAGVDRDVRGEDGASDHVPAWIRLKQMRDLKTRDKGRGQIGPVITAKILGHHQFAATVLGALGSRQPFSPQNYDTILDALNLAVESLLDRFHAAIFQKMDDIDGTRCGLSHDQFLVQDQGGSLRVPSPRVGGDGRFWVVHILA
jgi:hypothetical protein